MMLQLNKLSLYLVPLVIFSLFPVLLSAQDNMGGGKPAMSVTGCLKQGSTASGLHLMRQDCTMYEHMGPGWATHVNPAVTVIGHQVTLSATQEEKKEASEKAEAGGKPYVDMKVSSVKMVSESCQ